MGNEMIDTLKYSKKLEESGVPPEQAEAHVYLLADLLESNLAKRRDVQGVDKNIEFLRAETKRDIQGVERNIEVLRAETKKDIQGVERNIEVLRAETKRDIQDVKKEIEIMGHKLTIKMGAMGVTGVALLTAIQKLL